MEVVLLLFAIGWAAKAVGGGVAHAAAGISGRPSPTVAAWEAKEKARRASGHAPRQKPKSAFLTAWQNAVEKHVTKQEQKHHGQMAALRELGPGASDKARQKALKKANSRANFAAKSAKWLNTGRDRFSRIATDLHDVVTEKRAEAAARRADTDPEPTSESPDRQAQAAEAVADLDQQNQDENKQDDAQGSDAKVIPINRGKDNAGQDTDSDAESTENTNTATEGNSTMTATQQHAQNDTNNPALPEPTDLASSIQYANIVGAHLGNIGDKVIDDAAIFDNNAQALEQQVSAIETGQSSLAELGFTGGPIQGNLSKAAELAPAAAENFRQLQQLAQTLGEQLQEIRTAMAGVGNALKDQHNLADEVQSQDIVNGTANQTSFYREG